MNTTTAVVTIQPDTAKIETQGLALVTNSKIVVIDRTTYAQASKLKDAGKALLAEISATFDDHIAAAYKAHKSLLATKKKFSDPIESAIRELNRSMGSFEQEQERLRLAEQAKLQEQARKDQETMAVATAAQLERDGQKEAAAQVIQEAIEAPSPTVLLPKFDPNEYGRASRTVWKWKITDLAKLNLAYVSVQKNPATGLEQDLSTTGIGAFVRAVKNKQMAEQAISGIEVWSEVSTI